MAEKERVDPMLEAAMRANGWEEYLAPQRRADGSSQKPAVSRLVVDKFPARPRLGSDNCYPDGKKILGKDLGGPGVLESPNILGRGHKYEVRERKFDGLTREDMTHG